MVRRMVDFEQFKERKIKQTLYACEQMVLCNFSIQICIIQKKGKHITTS